MYDNPYSTRSRGLFVFLVDRSRHCLPTLGRGETIAHEAASEVNSWLQNLVIRCGKAEGVRDILDIAVIGYGSDAKGNPIIEPALLGPLAGRQLVSISEISKHHARMDEVLACILDEETGEILEMPTQCPVWIDPVAQGEPPLCAAIVEVCSIVDEWTQRFPESFPPIVVNITSGVFADGNPWPYADALKRRETREGRVLLLHQYISASGVVAPMLFPNDLRRLPDAPARALFSCSSQFPQELLRPHGPYGQLHVPGASPGCKCMSVNTSLVGLLHGLPLDSRW